MTMTYRKAVVVAVAMGFGLFAIDQKPRAAARYPTDPVSMATGLELAEIHCATCHAVGREGESPMKDAPRFRDLGKRYPLEDLEESLAEGIVTAHDGMPEFAFAPEDIDAFLGYLTSIQEQ